MFTRRQKSLMLDDRKNRKCVSGSANPNIRTTPMITWNVPETRR